MFGDVMDAKNRRPARKGAQMGSQRSREALFDRRAGQGADKTFPRGADQHGKPISLAQGAAGVDRLEVLAQGLAEADAGIEHDFFARDTRLFARA